MVSFFSSGDSMRSQRKPYVYTAYCNNYKYSTVVYATSIKQARQYGYYEAKKVLGKCAVIRRDLIEDMK